MAWHGVGVSFWAFVGFGSTGWKLIIRKSPAVSCFSPRSGLSLAQTERASLEARLEVLKAPVHCTDFSHFVWWSFGILSMGRSVKTNMVADHVMVHMLYHVITSEMSLACSHGVAMFPQLLVSTSQAEEKKSSEVFAARRAQGLAAHSGRKVGSRWATRSMISGCDTVDITNISRININDQYWK